MAFNNVRIGTVESYSLTMSKALLLDITTNQLTTGEFSTRCYNSIRLGLISSRYYEHFVCLNRISSNKFHITSITYRDTHNINRVKVNRNHIVRYVLCEQLKMSINYPIKSNIGARPSSYWYRAVFSGIKK